MKVKFNKGILGFLRFNLCKFYLKINNFKYIYLNKNRIIYYSKNPHLKSIEYICDNLKGEVY